MRRTRASQLVEAAMDVVADEYEREVEEVKRLKTVNLPRREKRLLSLQRLGGLARCEVPGPFLGAQLGSINPAALLALKALRLERLWQNEIRPLVKNDRSTKFCKKKGKVLGWDRQNLKDFKRYYTHIYALSCWAVKHHIHDSRAPWAPFVIQHFRLHKDFDIGRICVEVSS